MTLVRVVRDPDGPETLPWRGLLIGYVIAPLPVALVWALLVRRAMRRAGYGLPSPPWGEIAAFLNVTVSYTYLPALIAGLPLYLLLRTRLSAAALLRLLQIVMAAPLAVYFTRSVPLLLLRDLPVGDWGPTAYATWLIPLIGAWGAAMALGWDFEPTKPMLSPEGNQPRGTRPATAAPMRVLALISVGLALMCAGLAWSWNREHQAAESYRARIDCYSSVAEEGRVPQDRECQT